MKKPPVYLWFGLICLLLLVAAVGAAWVLVDLPDLDALSQRFQSPSVRIEDRHGRLLYEALPETGGRHAVAALDQLPQTLRQATIATEDRSFYTNPGVDLAGVLRAAWINLRGGQTLAGGSTITQQVARNLLLSDAERGQRSLRRKLREAVLAWQLTRRYTKDEILALYLNQSYYGGLAYGVEAAAQTYFGKPAARLDLAESALLAGLPQAPARYNPFTDLAAAKARQQVVLGLMEADGYITAEQRNLAEREPLRLAETPYPMEAPHFVMLARNQLDRLFTPEEAAAHGGLVVVTTLDLDWQKHAEAAVERQLSALAQSPDGLGHNVHNAALVALDPANGDLRALVGSPDYFDAASAGAINMALAPRQPGSALKPLIYAAAFDPAAPTGGWTPATLLWDVRTAFQTHDGKAYLPENYDRREHGPVLARQALASSLNIPAVLALEHVGLDAFSNLAARLGISNLGDPREVDLSLALGGGAVRLLDLTAAYGAFAAGGLWTPPRLILEVRTPQGAVLYRAPEPQRQRVLDQRVAWLVTDILSDNDARRLGFGANSLLRLDRPAAVKTGTTSNFHDNWTVGYTPDLVVGVWSGNTDYSPMRDVNGLTGAAPIWHQFLRTVLAGQPPAAFPRPAGLVEVEICALSGLLPTPDCPYRRREWFIQGTAPLQADTLYRPVQLDSATGRLAHADTPPERQAPRLALDLPPQAWGWARAQGLLVYSDLQTTALQAASAPAAGQQTPEAPGLTAQSRSVAATDALQLISPASGSQYRLSARLPAAQQRILLHAAAGPELSAITFYIDGLPLAAQPAAPYQAWWTLSPGQHQIMVQARLPDGSLVASQTVTITVIGSD